MDRNRKKKKDNHKQLTVDVMFYPRADVARSYFRRLSGGCILNGLEECVLDEEMELAYCVQNISEPLQKTVELEEIRKKMRNPPQTDDEKEETFEKIKKWKTISFMARYCVKQNKSRLRGHGIG